MGIDEFYYKQPEPKFISWLNSPLHDSAPKKFTRVAPNADEVSVFGAYVSACEAEWREIILTATDDFGAFLRSTGSFGDRYPIRIAYEAGH